jgi:hypothetical protein
MKIIQRFRDGSKAIIEDGKASCSCDEFKRNGICRHVNELMELIEDEEYESGGNQ